jgi:hypothetical protein
VRPVLLLEFNELTPALMSRFIEEGHLPNFRRLHGESQVYTTRAKETPPALEPWIQWVNVHSGLDYDEHGIFSLNEGHKLQQPAVWDLVSRAGHPVLVFGSMNVRYDPAIRGCVVPDPWTTNVAPHPRELEPYFRFVQKSVADSSTDAGLNPRDSLAFLRFMVTHGLSLETVGSVLRQLLQERTGQHRWKRAVLLDKLQFDVFAWYYRHMKPHFSTFFLNSTAHFQHLYWRSFAPELFAVKPDDRERAEHGSAILYGYRQMDRLVERFLSLAGPDATVILCTALSQQPCLIYEDSGGKVLYRPRDFEALLAFAGLERGYRVSPVMAEEFHLYLDAPDDVARGEALLDRLRVDDRPVLRVRERTERGLLLGCGIFHELSPDAQLRRTDSEACVPFFDVFYRIEGVKSGMHHPDGLLWIRNPDRAHRVHEEKIPLSAIAPTLLELFDVEPPAYMRGARLRSVA